MPHPFLEPTRLPGLTPSHGGRAGAPLRMPRHPSFVIPLLLALASPAVAQEVRGFVFHDLDLDGVADPGEPGLDGVVVTAWGQGAETSLPSASGAFAIPMGPGCRAIHVESPGAQWRRSFPDQSRCPTGPGPVGSRRYGAPEHLRANLADPSFTYVSLGDSIAAGVSVCFFDDTNYVEDVANELGCVAGRAVADDNRAVGGWHSEDLLTANDGGRPNPQYVPNVIAANPDLVTISIGGNDFLNTEPGAAGQDYPFAPADLAASLQELVHTRRTVQEILSSLTSELPLADIEINTVYDNLADACDTTDFHAASVTLWNQMLRNLAWGQVRPASIAEVQWEFAHQDVLRASCCGEEDMICVFDGIHPNETGAPILEHAVLESLGRVQVDAAAGAAGVDVGWVERVAELHPTRAVVLSGTVAGPDDALALDGAPATIGPGDASIELSGFALPAGLAADKVVVGLRYRTTAAFTDDRHFADASFVDFRAPAWTFEGWDTSTPLVGGSGTRGNIGALSVVNAVRDAPNWRDVSATVTLNATDDGRVTGWFEWPAPTAADIANLKVRVRTEAVNGPDAAALELDGAWAWVYGRRVGGAPGEVSGRAAATPLTVAKAPGGYAIRWGAEPQSATYRVHRGLVGSWDGAVADPGLGVGGCSTTTDFLDLPPPDSSGSWFWLVSGVSASGVEGPLGYWNDDPADTPRTAARAACP